MKNQNQIFSKIEEFYGNKRNHPRFEEIIKQHRARFGEGEIHLFSAPGRTEMGGNHTDHNHGCVLASGIHLDSIAVASKNDSGSIVVHSRGYEQQFEVDLSGLEPVARERESSTALIRGIAGRFRQMNYAIGGFSACISSDVLPGSGLSSSASFEVLIGTIFNHLFNDGRIPAVDIAKIGQYAENTYFGKPCGLMDQIACACGGIVMIDFSNPDDPLVERIQFDLEGCGYRLTITDTGGSHVDLTPDYAAVTWEMREVSRLTGHEYAREVTFDELLANSGKIRESAGDRALLRLFHFIEENRRAAEQAEALKRNDLPKFLDLVNESGNSSYKYLQNVYTTRNIKEQGISLALALTEKFIGKIGTGACRVHGGGFAGTIQAYLPVDHIVEYTRLMDGFFGDGSVKIIKLRESGALMF